MLRLNSPVKKVQSINIHIHKHATAYRSFIEINKQKIHRTKAVRVEHNHMVYVCMDLISSKLNILLLQLWQYLNNDFTLCQTVFCVFSLSPRIHINHKFHIVLFVSTLHPVKMILFLSFFFFILENGLTTTHGL